MKGCRPVCKPLHRDAPALIRASWHCNENCRVSRKPQSHFLSSVRRKDSKLLSLWPLVALGHSTLSAVLCPHWVPVFPENYAFRKHVSWWWFHFCCFCILCILFVWQKLYFVLTQIYFHPKVGISFVKNKIKSFLMTSFFLVCEMTWEKLLLNRCVCILAFLCFTRLKSLWREQSL